MPHSKFLSQVFQVRFWCRKRQIWSTHRVDWEDELKNEKDLENEDDLKTEDYLKNEDDLKNEDNLRNEDDMKKEDNIKNEEDLKNVKFQTIIHNPCIRNLMT